MEEKNYEFLNVRKHLMTCERDKNLWKWILNSVLERVWMGTLWKKEVKHGWVGYKSSMPSRIMYLMLILIQFPA